MYEHNGMVESYKVGPAADAYLRRLTPPKGYLVNELASYDQIAFDLHGIDSARVLA